MSNISSHSDEPPSEAPQTHRSESYAAFTDASVSPQVLQAWKTCVDEALTIAIRLGHFEIADFLIEEHGAR